MADRERSRVRPRVLIVLAAVAAASIALDQITKLLVVQNLELGEVVPVVGDLIQFHFVKNSGAAFSIGNAYTWIFSILAAAVTVFIVWFARRIRSLAWAVVFGLLLGGTIGNLIDRLFKEPGFGVGHVIDFITIPLLPAIFNLADVSITAAMVLFLILTIRGIGLDGKRHVVQKQSEQDADADDTVVGPGNDNREQV
ncbi:signal peptidase II [Herbiconiux ginsengi]|uniref:Lipoprotein signal peptidase n=1 Tax=Herbiconiux ginsengi TaxID=381665 RepID=A0A1H3QA96_9MICO|nr:signal peptidase II [Herbiconiux ginsengi]SDZ10472.1 signal peptidase II Aspartic peptidase. MEROPS family A08 [Herbiconiux ginsengi]